MPKYAADLYLYQKTGKHRRQKVLVLSDVFLSFQPQKGTGWSLGAEEPPSAKVFSIDWITHATGSDSYDIDEDSSLDGWFIVHIKTNEKISGKLKKYLLSLGWKIPD